MRVHDATVKRNVQLRTPVRISVIKSPVIINYRLYQVGVSDRLSSGRSYSVVC